MMARLGDALDDVMSKLSGVARVHLAFGRFAFRRPNTARGELLSAARRYAEHFEKVDPTALGDVLDQWVCERGDEWPTIAAIEDRLAARIGADT